MNPARPFVGQTWAGWDEGGGKKMRGKKWGRVATDFIVYPSSFCPRPGRSMRWGSFPVKPVLPPRLPIPPLNRTNLPRDAVFPPDDRCPPAPAGRSLGSKNRCESCVGPAPREERLPLAQPAFAGTMATAFAPTVGGTSRPTAGRFRRWRRAAAGCTARRNPLTRRAGANHAGVFP